MRRFPEAYATIFSAFTRPFMLLLFADVFRGVSLGFRNKQAQTMAPIVGLCLFAASLVATFWLESTANGLWESRSMNGENSPVGYSTSWDSPILLGFMTVA